MQRLAWATFSRVLQGLTTVLVLALWAVPAPAASTQDDEGWAFRFAPYIWGIAMDGDAPGCVGAWLTLGAGRG